MKVYAQALKPQLSSLRLQVSGFRSQLSPLKPVPSLAQRHPVQSPFVSLRPNLRFTPDSFHSLPLRRGSEAASHCRASSGFKSQVCSFTCPEGTQFSHPSLRSGQTFGSPSSHCRASSGFKSQVSALSSPLSALTERAAYTKSRRACGSALQLAPAS